ncbi:general stress protein [Methylocystis heyeri]|jgi:hypothetical protein|uniref:DUF1269 domain-containing protein n=1 Tax=Methylocystis heyeri TaxID=391905 RepID=A0A6B8KHR4_9HYPH|nr:DUF1269 domain-containing protein [Methylocystis heyeri]QGM46038.1 DUF1269 domain-containing protein [Methylocystis heyeri]
MERTDISVARFSDHTKAEEAVKALAQAGIDMKQLSIVGRGYHTEDNVVGFYNSGERIRFWGKYGAFWGSLWGLFGAGIFLSSPVTGPVMALGGLAVVLLSAVEGALAFGASSAIGAAIYSMGIPENSVLEYEHALKTDSFLVFVHGTAGDVARAKSILATLKPTHLDVHEGVTAGAIPAPVAHAAK